MKLKPCPFCGEAAELEKHPYNGSAKELWSVGCTNCGITKFDCYGPKENAIKYWNTRKKAKP